MASFQLQYFLVFSVIQLKICLYYISNIISQFHMPGRKDESYVHIHNIESCSICPILGMDMARRKIQFKRNAIW